MSHCRECGAALDPKAKGAPRSLAQHRRFFALMRAVYHHWPETHETQFGDETELRKWLTMKAGHREISARIPLVGIHRERALLIAEAAIRAAGSYAVPVIHGDTLVVFRPRSIAFAKLSHAAFCALNDAVDEVIRAETGLSPEQLLKETETTA